jgi:hypothetical protein
MSELLLARANEVIEKGEKLLAKLRALPPDQVFDGKARPPHRSIVWGLIADKPEYTVSELIACVERGVQKCYEVRTRFSDEQGNV